MIKTYTTVRRGFSHANYCQDFVWADTLGKLSVGVVSDGCSSGIDSHAASVITGKLFRKVLNERPIQAGENLPDYGEVLLRLFMPALREAGKILGIGAYELLATLCVGIYETAEKTFWGTILGDGAYAINDKVFRVEQNNTPEYPVYHLNDSAEELTAYLKAQSFFAENVQNAAISSDGVFTFINRENPEKENALRADEFLLLDETNNVSGMLNRKLNILEKKHKLLPYDDIGIVRWLNRENVQN